MNLMKDVVPYSLSSLFPRLVSTAYNFARQNVGPDHFVGPDLDLNCLTL